MDFSHSALRTAPEETFAILGLYFSLKGKLSDDICFIPLMLGRISCRAYKFFQWFFVKQKRNSVI
jgi:hypothetical protein